MKILWRGFAGKNHSWSVVAQNICRYLKAKGHTVDIYSTNGISLIPDDLQENIIGFNEEGEKYSPDKIPGTDYDLALSYTAMLHWGEYLFHSKKNRFAIWNYDGTQIPSGWAKFYLHTTKVLPSSQFSYDVFKKAGVPESVMTIVPHGVSDEFLNGGTGVYPIETDRKRKVLVNIAQMHTRKNIGGLLEAWGRAFTEKDDVIMVAKVSMKHPKQPFEVSWMNNLLDMKKKFKNHAPILVINDFIPNISDLYRACDIGYSASSIECFNLPALESMVCGNITIGSNYGGNVDFMNENNSLLIRGKVGRAPANFQYWKSSLFGECFYPDVDHTAELLRMSVDRYDELKERFTPGMKEVRERYTWENVINQILSLCAPE